ncbi:unnamed protein product [Albugo candida]|uniref:Uncharacterized protein n=1 Tax=Albugo candida TaxID=65357 RepID=A0A024FWG2_9STRA|nr:unnamed protein product [Albugo candida]|eukprot:CCI11386.1 unnamed protein product [Albugo candida]
MNALDWSVLTYKQVRSKSWTFLPYCIARLTPVIIFIFSPSSTSENMSLRHTIISLRALVPSIGIVFPHEAFVCATIMRRTSAQPYKPNVKNLLISRLYKTLSMYLTKVLYQDPEISFSRRTVQWQHEWMKLK